MADAEVLQGEIGYLNELVSFLSDQLQEACKERDELRAHAECAKRAQLVAERELNSSLASCAITEARLRDDLEFSQTELRRYVTVLAQAERERDELRTEVAKLKELLDDVACSGVTFSDPRISYVEVQIGVGTWADVRREAGRGA